MSAEKLLKLRVVFFDAAAFVLKGSQNSGAFPFRDFSIVSTTELPGLRFLIALLFLMINT